MYQDDHNFLQIILIRNGCETFACNCTSLALPIITQVRDSISVGKIYQGYEKRCWSIWMRCSWHHSTNLIRNLSRPCQPIDQMPSLINQKFLKEYLWNLCVCIKKVNILIAILCTNFIILLCIISVYLSY